MMELTLTNVEGPGRGTECRMEEAGTYSFGRDDPSCKADFKFSAEDREVSRLHFEVELEPSGCTIKDRSSYGTYLEKEGEWERITESPLRDGDRLKVGGTVISVALSLDEPYSGDSSKMILDLGKMKRSESGDISFLFGGSDEARSEDDGVLRCIVCGEPIENPPSPEDVMRNTDFMCEKHRKQAKAESAEPPEHEGATFRCEVCEKDLSEQADSDHRAWEVHDFCTYLCEKHAMEKAEADLEPGEIGEYRILRLLGTGGFGRVYEAWHRKTWRIVAIKQMLDVNADRDLVLRFQREIAINQDIRHPNLVRMFEAGESKHGPYIVMEFMPDGELSQFLSDDGEPQLEPVEATLMIADALQGLAYFHGCGYVHRDIKPENIFLKRSGDGFVAKVADYGLSRSYVRHGGTITSTGTMGTMHFIASDQIANFKRARPTVDIYATGAVLYYLLSGALPVKIPPPWKLKRDIGARMRFMTLDPIQVILRQDYTPLLEAKSDLPVGLAEVVDKAVAKDPSKRYQTAGEFREALLGAVGR